MTREERVLRKREALLASCREFVAAESGSIHMTDDEMRKLAWKLHIRSIRFYHTFKKDK